MKYTQGEFKTHEEKGNKMIWCKAGGVVIKREGAEIKKSRNWAQGIRTGSVHHEGRVDPLI